MKSFHETFADLFTGLLQTCREGDGRGIAWRKYRPPFHFAKVQLLRKVAKGCTALWILAAACAPPTQQTVQRQAQPQQPLYAHFETSLGTIVVELFPKQAPETVANFVGLAQGTKEWTDPRTGQKVRRRFYDGLIFHRVIPNFMIQGGDPLGNGTGGPGYRFQDEIAPELGFDRPGRLAMANAGPNTNGSQFFITVAPTPWLNGKHTIFGQVVQGQEVAVAISEAAQNAANQPLKPIRIQKLTIPQTLR
ncbi:MAG: peptidylprolyl isomerase [Elusimicrobia bacterium]|nr:peptidylprolyl isomerase [Elusimicrobiota bacterium]